MPTVQIQSIGKRPGKAVKDLKRGDVIMWNFGYTSTVLELIPSKTGKTITAVLHENASGKVVNRKMGANRLVAMA